MRKPLSEPTEGRTSLSRRTLFAGASTVGALAAAAVLIPRVKTEEAAAVALDEALVALVAAAVALLAAAVAEVAALVAEPRIEST